MESREILMRTSYEVNGGWKELYQKLLNKDMNMEGLVSFNGKYLTILDKEYPAYLKQKYMPSMVFAYEGNLDLLNAPKRIGIAVSKDDGNFNRFNRNLEAKKNDLVMVIGYSTFIEKEIINNGYKVICVIDKPIDELNGDLRATIINNGGLIITENIKQRCDFSEHLRVAQLRSHIENTLLVVSTTAHSTGVFQVGQALQNGYNVLVFPTDMESHLINNQFIYEGADIFHTVEQL